MISPNNNLKLNIKINISSIIIQNMSIANVNEMDQSTWVCYQFDGSSYYYGEVGYLD
jgi:hypothetical protein